MPSSSGDDIQQMLKFAAGITAMALKLAKVGAIQTMMSSTIANLHLEGVVQTPEMATIAAGIALLSLIPPEIGRVLLKAAWASVKGITNLTTIIVPAGVRAVYKIVHATLHVLDNVTTMVSARPGYYIARYAPTGWCRRLDQLMGPFNPASTALKIRAMEDNWPKPIPSDILRTYIAIQLMIDMLETREKTGSRMVSDKHQFYALWIASAIFPNKTRPPANEKYLYFDDIMSAADRTDPELFIPAWFDGTNPGKNTIDALRAHKVCNHDLIKNFDFFLTEIPAEKSSKLTYVDMIREASSSSSSDDDRSLVLRCISKLISTHARTINLQIGTTTIKPEILWKFLLMPVTNTLTRNIIPMLTETDITTHFPELWANIRFQPLTWCTYYRAWLPRNCIECYGKSGEYIDLTIERAPHLVCHEIDLEEDRTLQIYRFRTSDLQIHFNRISNVDKQCWLDVTPSVAGILLACVAANANDDLTTFSRALVVLTNKASQLSVFHENNGMTVNKLQFYMLVTQTVQFDASSLVTGTFIFHCLINNKIIEAKVPMDKLEAVHFVDLPTHAVPFCVTVIAPRILANLPATMRPNDRDDSSYSGKFNGPDPYDDQFLIAFKKIGPAYDDTIHTHTHGAYVNVEGTKANAAVYFAISLLLDDVDDRVEYCINNDNPYNYHDVAARAESSPIPMHVDLNCICYATVQTNDNVQLDTDFIANAASCIATAENLHSTVLRVTHERVACYAHATSDRPVDVHTNALYACIKTKCRLHNVMHDILNNAYAAHVILNEKHSVFMQRLNLDAFVSESTVIEPPTFHDVYAEFKRKYTPTPANLALLNYHCSEAKFKL